MRKPSKYINDICSNCHPQSYDLTLAKFAGEENIVEVVGDVDESFIEYLYECCECGEKAWVGDHWVRDNSVEVTNHKEGDGIEMKNIYNIEETQELLVSVKNLSVDERSEMLNTLIGKFSSNQQFLFSLNQAKELMELRK